VLAEQAAAQQPGSEDGGGDSTDAIVAVGLGALALALVAGWFWYGRRLS
jgi:hypothetical protein